MPVMPEKTASIARVYPTRVLQGTLDVITLPGRVYAPIDFVRDVWSDLTTFGGGQKRKKHEPPPKPTGLMLSRDYRSGTGTSYETSERAAADFYSMLSKRTGVPVREAPYEVMMRHLKGSVEPDRYIAGLYNVYDNGERIILVSGTDHQGEPIPLLDRVAAGYHEAGHAMGGRTEREAQKIAIRMAKEDGITLASKKLVEMLENDGYFSRN